MINIKYCPECKRAGIKNEILVDRTIYSYFDENKNINYREILDYYCDKGHKIMQLRKDLGEQKGFII